MHLHGRAESSSEMFRDGCSADGGVSELLGRSLFKRQPSTGLICFHGYREKGFVSSWAERNPIAAWVECRLSDFSLWLVWGSCFFGGSSRESVRTDALEQTFPWFCAGRCRWSRERGLLSNVFFRIAFSTKMVSISASVCMLVLESTPSHLCFRRKQLLALRISTGLWRSIFFSSR